MSTANGIFPRNATLLAYKKLVANKFHTNPTFLDSQEPIDTSIQVSKIFGQPINSNPSQATSLVRQVTLNLFPLPSSIYSINDGVFGTGASTDFYRGVMSSDSNNFNVNPTEHAFAAIINGSCFYDSSNTAHSKTNAWRALYNIPPSVGATASAIDSHISQNSVQNFLVHLSKGEIQFVPFLYGNAYTVKVLDSNNNEILPSEGFDFVFDYYSGVLWVQDIPSNSSRIPAKIEAYIYLGSFVDERLEALSSGGSSLWEVVSSPANTIQPKNNRNVLINGNLTVIGNSTSIQTTNLDVDDNIIILNRASAGGQRFSGIAARDITNTTPEYGYFLWDSNFNVFRAGISNHDPNNNTNPPFEQLERILTYKVANNGQSSYNENTSLPVDGALPIYDATTSRFMVTNVIDGGTF